jgi:putative (di)nucleoside polyphosphate hydrolase
MGNRGHLQKVIVGDQGYAVGTLSQHFRAGAGAAILNDHGHVLALERVDVAGAWQLPQGGLEKSEEPLDAIMREVAEETGLSADSLELLGRYPEPLAYELPAPARSEKTGRGQVQYWFVFRFRGREVDIAPGGEFRRWSWMPFDKLLDRAVEFRKPIYRKLAEYSRQFVSR